MIRHSMPEVSMSSSGGNNKARTSGGALSTLPIWRRNSCLAQKLERPALVGKNSSIRQLWRGESFYAPLRTSRLRMLARRLSVTARSTAAPREAPSTSHVPGMAACDRVLPFGTPCPPHVA
jgi:hypothetical protein